MGTLLLTAHGDIIKNAQHSQNVNDSDPLRGWSIRLANLTPGFDCPRAFYITIAMEVDLIV